MGWTSAALLLVALAMGLAIVRAWRGPSAADRVIAAELGFVAAVAAIVLAEVVQDLPVLLDLALLAVLIGFLATVALSRLVAGREAEDVD